MTYNGGMKFEWDAEKNLRNKTRHGIASKEAVLVFEAEAECLDLFDELHSDFEERFITVGPSPAGLGLVVWTERDGGVIRIISARLATPRE